MNRFISLRIDSDAELMKLIPEEWLLFFRVGEPQSDKIVIHLRSSLELNDRNFPEGWSVYEADGIRQAVFALHGKAFFSLFYHIPTNEVTVSVRRALGSYVRSGILYGTLTALYRNYVGLHGVTLSCSGRNVILSAPSGTGKTTLSRLLEAECGARVINGDFALLSVGGESAMFEPTPFCGTSGICLDERVRVDRIVFLEQSETNRWRDLDGRAALLNLLNNAFVPTFDRRIQQAVRENIMRILSQVPASSFAFAPTGEAAALFADMIQREEASSQ